MIILTLATAFLPYAYKKYTINKCYKSKIKELQKNNGYVFPYKKRYVKLMCEHPEYNNK